MIPPQRFGGNLDNRLHGAGTRLELPVQRPGGLLSVGDPHALQGDGEVCGTGIEIPATVRLRVDLLRGEGGPGPRARANRPAHASGRWRVTEGVGPDILGAARSAVEDMITVLGAEGLEPPEVYLLSSIVGELRLSEVVDEPHFVVSLLFPEEVIRAAADAPRLPSR